MATFNTTAAEHSTTTFVATPVQLDQNSAGPFATASHFITTSTPSANLHRQASAVTSNATSSSYTFLQIKREPCQVSEVTTSNHCHQQQHQQQQHHGVCSATSSTSISATGGTTSKTVSASTLTTLVKIEPPSPKVSDLLDKSSAVSAVAATLSGNTNNSVPIGIAVARKRPQESSTLANCSSTAIPLSQAINKDLNCFGFRVADLGGVGAGCGNFFFTGNGDLMTGSTAAATSAEEFALSAAGVQNVNRAPSSTIWQYPSAALPFESVISMSPATVGLQYSREASRAAGQVVLLPAATAAALGISNIPPLCYTPTDPFQQAAAAAALVWPSAATAAYIPQGAATSATATLQPPPNFIFPTMNTTAAHTAATLQPQSYAAAASLQLFGSNYLRNATEFMAAANKTTTTTQQNHLITTSCAPATLTLPPTPLSATTALSFETRDKTTMTTTTTTNLLELQSNAQALNLIRLPTPPTSATIQCGNGNENSHHLQPQILFQTTTATAANSPTPTLLNLSTNSSGHTAPAAILPRPPNLNIVGPPTPAGDEPSTTTTPLPLNFKTAPIVNCSDENNSIVNGVSARVFGAATVAAAAATQPQMQDVNIQTETPVCSEDENSSCLHAQQAIMGATDACLTPPAYNGSNENSEEATEPLELTKTRNEAEEMNFNEQPQVMKTNMCHNENEEVYSNLRNDNCEMTIENNEQQNCQIEEQENSTVNDNEASSTNDFAGLELLSNISTSTLVNKPVETTTAAILRVKQEPIDSMEEMQQSFQQQQQQQQQQHAQLIMPTIAAKLEHPTPAAITNNHSNFERPSSVQSASLLPITAQQSHLQLNGNETTINNGCNGRFEVPNVPSTVAVNAEPMPSGLNLLCALVEQRIQEEEGVQGSSLFANSSTNSTSQHGTPLSTYSTYQQQQQPTPPYRHNEQSTFPSMDGIELPTAAGSIETIVTPTPTLHVKRKKHKHSKSSKSSTSASSTCSALLNNANGISVKSSKRCSKKNKKKNSKEKRCQQRAAVAAELDIEDEQLQAELQKALISSTCTNGNSNAAAAAAAAAATGNVKWPSAHEIFNRMESSLRQKLAEITRQYRKKKRKLDKISKTQRKKKESTKLLAQQLQQQLQQHQQQQQQQQQTLQPPTLATSTLGSTLVAPTTSPLSDYKFSTKFSTNAIATGPQIPGTTPYLQSSNFPLRFPPQAPSTADDSNERNSQQQQQQRTHKRQPIYKPVRLEPSALSAAIVANGNSSNSTTATITTATINDNNSSINVALRLAQKHEPTVANTLTSNCKERKLISKIKTKRRSSEGNPKISPKPATSNGITDSPSSAASPSKRPRNQNDVELTLTNEHLYRKETRVLTDMGGLFYAGIMKPLQPPDIYAITLDGERGNKPHIMSREEIFKDTILEVAPKSIESVPVGTRLCAYWSQQYRCLYPGRAIESESCEGDEETPEKDFVSVEFDDGDSGRIRLQNIRMLLSDYPIVEYNDNPLYSLGKQKKTAMKNGGGSSSTIEQHDANAVLHDTSLGLSALMLGGDDGDEMYARRTDKKRSKKNFKKIKTQQPQSCVIVNSLNDNIAIGNDNNNVEHSRKHRKHKKHKKDKKHHRKAASLHDAEQATNSFKMVTSSPNGTYDATEPNTAISLAIENVEEKKVQVTYKPIKLEEVGVNVKTEQIEELEAEESASNMMSENSDEAKGDEDDDEVEHNNSKGSKIAAFLPERQLWGWQGMAYRRAGVKGRARKQFYKSIKRGKELITVGDCAVFLSTGRPDRPYIGRIESMWETASSNKVVRVRWFYHPEETTGCPTLKYPGGLFESPHEDENDVQTISHRCEVLPFARYFEKFGADAKQYQSIYDNNDTYYLAGYYNPRALTLNLQDDIPTKNDAIMTTEKNDKKTAELQKNINTGASIP